MKIKDLYLVTGMGKDPDDECRKKIKEIIADTGANEVSSPDQAGLIVVMGGDGTIMRASHLAHRYDIPIIGVNLGRIGYMAELETDELDRLRDVINGRYTEEKRMMLSVSYGGAEYECLNDAVVRAKTTHPATVKLECDGQTVNTYCGDGLICATPTGSTAYSVSAGGSVVDPRLQCLCITPLCPQSLNARPLIFAPSCSLTLRACEGYECILTVDGGPSITLEPNKEVVIKKSPRSLRMLRISDTGFYTVLSKKLYI